MPKVNVISFNGDLEEKLSSIGLNVNLKNMTIGDRAITDITESDDEDFSPVDVSEDDEADLTIDNKEGAELEQYPAQSTGLSFKTKMIIGAVATVAMIGIGLYFGSYFSGSSALNACNAEKEARS